MLGTTAQSLTVYTQGVGTSTFASTVPEIPKLPTIKLYSAVAVAAPSTPCS